MRSAPCRFVGRALAAAVGGQDHERIWSACISVAEGSPIGIEGQACVFSVCMQIWTSHTACMFKATLLAGVARAALGLQIATLICAYFDAGVRGSASCLIRRPLPRRVL